MTRRADFLALAARVEAAQGADRELDAEIDRAIGTPGWRLSEAQRWFCNDTRRPPAYTASLDAAASLIGERMWRVGNDGKGADPGAYLAEVLGMYVTHRCVAATPALAMTAAALRAVAEEAQQDVA